MQRPVVFVRPSALASRSHSPALPHLRVREKSPRRDQSRVLQYALPMANRPVPASRPAPVAQALSPPGSVSPPRPVAVFVRSPFPRPASGDLQSPGALRL